MAKLIINFGAMAPEAFTTPPEAAPGPSSIILGGDMSPSTDGAKMAKNGGQKAQIKLGRTNECIPSIHPEGMDGMKDEASPSAVSVPERHFLASGDGGTGEGVSTNPAQSAADGWRKNPVENRKLAP